LFFVAGILTETSLLLVFRAITKSRDAITAAETHAGSINAYDNFGDGQSDAVTAFATAVEKIKEAFNKYGVRPTLIVIGPG
jgi:hypothetical protein